MEEHLASNFFMVFLHELVSFQLSIAIKMQFQGILLIQHNALNSVEVLVCDNTFR